MMSASVTDKLTAARRRLTKAVRLGADTAEIRAEIALLERRAVYDADRVAAKNVAAAKSRYHNSKRLFDGYARRLLEGFIASLFEPRSVGDARHVLKPDIIAAHRAALNTLLSSVQAMKAASCSVPAANVANLAKSISALDARRQAIVDRRARSEHRPSDDRILLLLRKDRAELARFHDAAQQTRARAEMAETAATKVYEAARQASKTLDARIKLIVLVGGQLTLVDQAMAVAAQVTTLLGSNTLDQAAAEDGLKALLRHAQTLNAALQVTIGHIDAVTLLGRSAGRPALDVSSAFLPPPDEPAAGQDKS